MGFDFERMSCVGILGGTFNPVHNGHLMMARMAYEQFDDIEKIVIMPNNLPAYKDSKSIVDNYHRLNMLELAVSDMEYVEISDLEIMRGGVTYTIDTLNQIKHINREIKIYYVIGADSLYSFTKWYKFEEIFSICTLLVVSRDTRADDMQKCADELKRQYGADIRFVRCGEVKASSTEIRKRIMSGEKPYDLLPDSVIEYIFNNKLYM